MKDVFNQLTTKNDSLFWKMVHYFENWLYRVIRNACMWQTFSQFRSSLCIFYTDCAYLYYIYYMYVCMCSVKMQSFQFLFKKYPINVTSGVASLAKVIKNCSFLQRSHEQKNFTSCHLWFRWQQSNTRVGCVAFFRTVVTQFNRTHCNKL